MNKKTVMVGAGRKWRWQAVATVAALSLALTACAGGGGGSSSGGNESGGSKSGGTLTLGNTAVPTSFDPAIQQSTGVQAPYMQAVYDTLLVATPKAELKPSLAESWKYNDDNTVLTLKLRTGVKFSDGSALTAAVVKSNLERFKAGTNPDAKDLADVSSIEAPDDTTVVITLSQANPALTWALASSAGTIASGDAIKDASGLATTPVGSGAYVLDTAATVSGTSYTYTKNKNYWNKSAQHYDKIVLKFLADQTAALNAIKAGEVNGARLVNNTDASQVESLGWTMNYGQYDFQGMVLFDRNGTISPALKDVRVRQAINYAFDRKAMLKALQDGRGDLTNQVFSPDSPAYEKKLDDTYSYDPKKAKKLLADAGYADGFTLVIPTVPAFGTALYSLIGQQLQEVGIKTEFVDTGNNFIADQLGAKYAASYMSLGFLIPDFRHVNTYLADDAPWNAFKVPDTEVQDRITKMRTADEATSTKLAQEINERVVDQAWFAPFYRKNVYFVTDSKTEVAMGKTNSWPNILEFSPKG